MKFELIALLIIVGGMVAAAGKGAHWFIRTLRWSLRARLQQEIRSLRKVNQRFHAEVEELAKRVERDIPDVETLISDLSSNSRNNKVSEAAKILLDLRRELVSAPFAAISASDRRSQFEHRIVDAEQVLLRRTGR